MLSEQDWWASVKSQMQLPTQKVNEINEPTSNDGIAKYDPQEKEDNFNAIKDLHRQIDFKLLLNENLKFKKGNSELAIVGVENWGKHFKKVGDLAKASEGLTKEDFKILLSHDPSHWDAEVQHDENHYQLDLYLFFDIFSFAHNNTYQTGISSTCLTAHRSCLAASELTPQQLTLML